jgi:peroxiredoxin
MRTIFKFAILVLSCFSTPKVFSQHKFVISGVLPSANDVVEIDLRIGNSVNPQIMTFSKNGQFQLSGELKYEFEQVVLSLYTKDGGILGSSSFFIKEGQMKITIVQLGGSKEKPLIAKCDFADPFEKEQKEYRNLIKPIDDSIYRYGNLIFVNKQSPGKYNADSLELINSSFRREKIKADLRFIKKESNSYFGLYVFNTEIIEQGIDIHPDTLLSVYNCFDSSLQNTALGKSVMDYIRKCQSLLVGNIMPDFSFMTNEGQHYQLASFQKEKYVLLCFWSSGCGPCVKSIPILRELTKQYETKGLQIISVSTDINEDKWLNALKRYEMSWLQTCDLPKYIRESRADILYNIKFIPQYFLIDKEGKLVYQNCQLQDTDDYEILKTKLKELLN